MPTAVSRWLPQQARLPFALATLLILYAILNCALLSVFTPGSDWAPLWVAGRLAWTHPLQAYDFSTVTNLQGPLVGPTSERPFVYPPTSLLLLAPLGLLPFRLSFAAFVALSLVILGKVSSRLGATPLLSWTAPPVVLAAIAGQPTLVVTALVVAALLDLPANQRRAGLLLGVAAVVKPPLLLLAPFALLGGKHWRSLATAGLTVIGFTAASLFLFGIEAWQAWFAALPRFQALVVGYEPLLRNTVTPHATLLRLGFDSQWTGLWLALIVIPLVVLAFARSRDVSVRLVMLLGGALLMTPYGMNYELAALAPAVAAMPLHRPRDTVLPTIWATSLFVQASVVGLIVIYCWAVEKLFACLRADDRPVQAGIDISAR